MKKATELRSTVDQLLESSSRPADGSSDSTRLSYTPPLQNIPPAEVIALAQQCSDRVSPQCIPKIIHKIWWQGESVIPKVYHSSLKSWRDHHPDWTIIVWDHASLEAVIRQHFPEYLEMFQGYPRMIQRIDAAKYFILCHFGGVYTDMGMY